MANILTSTELAAKLALLPTRVFKTSSTCTSDADLEIGSSTFGTDQTTALQAILDEAADGPIVVIWDGAYSSTGLRIRGNTRIEAYPGCGMILRSTSNRPLIRNYNPSASTITDENIEIIGGIWNGNGGNQAHNVAAGGAWSGWVVGFEFHGVRNVRLKDLQLYRPRTFATLFSNWEHVTIDNTRIDVGPAEAFNYDGHHFNGPGRYCSVKNLIVSSRDDGLAFNANEPLLTAPVGDMNTANYSPYFTTGGDITDVLVDGLTFADSYYGMRLLCSTSRIDRIQIRNVIGRTNFQWLIIDNYPEDNASMVPDGTGNFGSISIDNVDVELVGEGYKHCYIYMEAVIDDVRLTNIKRSNFALSDYPTIAVAPSAHIKMLSLNNSNSYASAHTNASNQILVAGSVETLRLSNNSFVSVLGEGTGAPVSITGSVVSLIANNNLTVGFADLITNTGTIKNNHSTDNFEDIPSTWLLDIGWTEVNATDLTVVPLNASKAFLAVKRSNDAFSGNMTLTASFKLNSAGPAAGTSSLLGLLVRGSSLNPWVAATSYYATLDWGSGGLGLKSGKQVTGTDTVFDSVAAGGGSFAEDIDYSVELTVDGSSIATRVQRLSDNKWLDSGGSWQTGEQTAIFATDSAIAAGAKQYGLLAYSNAAAHLEVSDFTAATADLPIASTWNFESGYTEISATEVTVIPPTSGQAYIARKTTNDELGGNVSLTANLRLNSAGPAAGTSTLLGLLVRGTSLAPWSGASAYYALINWGSGGSGFEVGKEIAGSATILATRGSGASFAEDVDYTVEIIANGTSVQAKVQRQSDMQWLDSSGNWQVTEQTAVSVTDSSITASSKQYGILAYSNTAAQLEVSDFTIAAA